MTAWRTTGEITRSRPRHAGRRGALRRVEDRLPAPRRRGLHPAAAPGSRRWWRSPCTAGAARSSRPPRRSCGSAASLGGKYLGDEISAGDWASRHDRYAIPLHGRRKDGQAVLMSWHCEDAALNYSVLPQVREEWHAIVARYRERYDIFDDWGMFAYTNGAYKPWATTWSRSTSASGSSASTRSPGQAWVACKREISEVSLRHGGSITACHGATPGGRRRARPTGDGQRVARRQADQAGTGPQQRDEPGQAVPRRGLRGGRPP